MEEYESLPNKVITRLLNEIQLSKNGAKLGIITFGPKDTIWANLSSNEEYIRSISLELSKQEAKGDSYLESELYSIINKMMDQDAEDRKEEVPNIMIIISDGGFNRPLITKDQTAFFKLRNRDKLKFAISSIFIRIESEGDAYAKSGFSNLTEMSDEGFCFSFEDYPKLIDKIKELNFCL